MKTFTSEDRVRCENPCGDCDTGNGCFHTGTVIVNGGASFIYTEKQPVAWRFKRQLVDGGTYYEYYEDPVPNAEPLYTKENL